MAIYKDNISESTTQQLQIYYPKNILAKGYLLRNQDADYTYQVLLPEEIIEQCLALVYAILECNNNSVKESLTLILEERLLLLKNKYIE